MPKSIIQTAFFALALIYSINVSAQQFTLTGKLLGQPDVPIILNYINADGKSVKDSTTIVNGNFTFKGNINGGILAELTLSRSSSKFKKGTDRNMSEIFLEPANITATGNFDDLKTLKFSGSKSQAEFELLQSMFQPTTAAMAAIEDKYLANQGELFRIMRIDKNDARLASIEKTMDSLNDILVDNYNKYSREFIAGHPQSYVSAYELYTEKTRWNIREVTKTFNQLGRDMQNGYYGKQVQNIITGIAENAAGKVARDFSSVDANGKAISLSGLKGKYVLLDFWGSWCGRCRASTPHVKELFTKYHNAGFEVLAIACDDTPNDWKEAIAKDGTDMFQNILQEKRSDANKNKLIDDQYNIHVFPTKILVGKDGIIVGRYDGTESTKQLDRDLAEIFK